MEVQGGKENMTADHQLPPTRKRQQRHLLACVGCRKIKTRCLGNEDQVSPCQRCLRLNLQCVYARKRRRKPQGESGGVDGDEDEEEASGSLEGQTSFTSYPEAAELPRRPSMRPDVISESSVRFTTPSPSSSSIKPTIPAPTIAAPKRVDIRAYLDPELPRDVNGAEITADGGVRAAENGYVEDPINLQLLAVREAETLLGLYMQHINPLIATLEPQLHTLAWVRSSSPILLSAMMTVASKFFRRPLYRSLLAHTNTIVNRAVGMGHCDIGLVQALIIMVCWKDPTDGSSWVKLGIAIRLGYQLGLHVLRTQPLPANEFEARIVANAERTWYTVSSFDRLYSDVYGLPPTVRLEEIPDAVRWAEETAWLGCGDMRHACSFSSASTYRMWVKYRRNLHTMSRDLAWAILDDLYAQIDQHMNHWFPADPSTGMITTFEQTYLKWFDLNHLLKIKYHMLDICAPHERDAAVLDWLLLAESFAKQTEALGLLGTLRYFQDTSATHISSFGVMVYNLFSRLPSFQKRLVTEHVKRLSKCCDNATLGDGETVMGFVGRFMQRLLLVLQNSQEVEHAALHGGGHGPESGSGSVPGSAHVPPHGVHGVGPGGGPPGLGMLHGMPLPPPDPAHGFGETLDLDGFFRAMLQNGQNALQDLVTTDNQFWFDPNMPLP